MRRGPQLSQPKHSTTQLPNSCSRTNARLGTPYCVRPTAGAIADVLVEENETVPSGQPIVRLASGTHPEIVLAVSEVTIPFLSVGDKVEVSLDALPGRLFAATLSEVGVAASPEASTFPAVARLDEASDVVRSGMAADVRLQLQTGGTEGVLVPFVSVGEDTRGRFVFVLEPDGAGEEGTVRRRPVTVGETLQAGSIHVVSGVRPGERVVTAGVRRLVDGMRVLHLGNGAGSPALGRTQETPAADEPPQVEGE